ncbi:amino acid adenylation domain-containing protein [Nocardia asteroides]
MTHADAARRAYGIDDLPDLIAIVAGREPRRVALRQGEVTVTYAALAEELAAPGPDRGALVSAVVSGRLPALLAAGDGALGAVLDALLDNALAAMPDLPAAAPVETLVSQFRAQVRRTPDAIALEYAGVELTYAEFEGRVNALAHRLIELGVRRDTLVGLAVRRSINLLVGMYAILAAGGAYVPIDPDHPADRKAHVLAVADPVLVLTTTHDEPDLGCAARTLRIDELADAPTSRPPAFARSADDTAYVIFTFDSTGRPKGVAVSHRSIVANLRWRQRMYRLRADDVVLQKTPFTFDASVWECFWPLQVGARLVVAEPDGHRDPAYLARVIAARGVTVAHFVPSGLAMFVAEAAAAVDSLRLVFASGETLPSATAAAFRDISGATLHNLYGLTEATVDVTAHEVTGADVAGVPIGLPADDTELLVLDDSLRPVARGVVGELYLAGVQLARGYVARPGLTAERFVANPEGPAGERMYRTGDLVRWAPGSDGGPDELEFLGRGDSQVTLRGPRIELPEVEAALLAAPEVSQAAARLVTGPAGDFLAGYVIAVPGARVDVAALESYVAQRLPAHMVPTALVVLNEFPRHPSGKVDRAALPVPVLAAERFRPPVDAAQRLVAAVFREVLRVRRVGLDDDFFALGGSSLDAIQITARTGEAVGVRVPVRALFAAPTVAGFAAVVERLGVTPPTGIPLVRRRRPERVPLAPAQQRLWFLNRIESQDGADSVHNLPIVLRLTGRLDVTALERAVLDVLARHEMLRTIYPETGDGPYQSVLHMGDLDLSLRPVPIGRAAAEDAVAGIVRAGFDVTAESPFRVALLAVDRADEARGGTADEYLLVLVVHHIAADALSMAPLVTDLILAYLARSTGRRPEWAALPVRYADYSLWHRELLGADDVPGDLAYQQLRFWRNVLADAPAQLPLPADRPRPAVAAHQGAAVEFVIPAEVATGLRALARRGGATLFMTLHAAWAATLARLSGSRDIVIGVPVGGRGERALDALVGMFVNTLALRTRVAADAAFADLLAEVRDGDLAAFANADLPFERLVDAIGVDRSCGAHPLFQVMFGYEAATPAFGAVTEVPWLSVCPVEIADTGTEFDLHLIVREKAGSAELSGVLRYATDLFDAATAESYATRLRRMLATVAVDPGARIGDIELLSDAERGRMLREWNATAHPVPESGTLAALFAAQAARTPDAPAVTFEGTTSAHASPDHYLSRSRSTTLTYAELAGRVNRLARWLVARGVGPESLVALGMRRSIDLVVGVHAVVTAGGGYVPLDPDQPAAHTAHILAMAAPVCVLTSGEDLRCGHAETRLDRLDLSGYSDAPLTDADRRAPLHPANTAYVLFTPESTGAPKGVVMSHRGIVNRLRWIQSAYAALGPDDVLLQQTPATCDMSVPEIFWPLQVGARMVLARPDSHRDPASLARLIRSEGVTVAHFAPSTFAAVVAGALDLPSLREVFCSGEALPAGIAQRMRAQTGARVHNGYGPTEAAVQVTFHEVRDTDFVSVPLGKPIWNTRVYVLDARLRPVPVGVPGELYLAGAQLARGYLGRPDLTGGRFVADPFGPPGERLYRTGDLGKWTPTGELVLLSRTDSQVWIRGLRVELGEIEAALLATPGVGQAAVLVRDDRGAGKQLAAYLVADGPLAIADVRDSMAEQLPGSLVPQAFMMLERFPLDAAGKLDRAALPAPLLAPTVFQPPSGKAEELVADTFAAVLGVSGVGAEDDFFALGGNSLGATRLAARLGRATGVEVAVRTIFDAPTVRALARRITVAGPIAAESAALPLTPRERGAPIPLSIAQQRRWRHGGATQMPPAGTEPVARPVPAARVPDSSRSRRAPGSA